MSIPVISVTDIYHPAEDPGDNFDLIMPFALPELDLRAVVIDVTAEMRHRVEGGVPGFQSVRDPGIIPMLQLNHLFDRDVPWALGPFRRMRSIDDRMVDVPGTQQRGIELILDVLRRSAEPVHILSFGSARTIAAAYNRDPELMRSKLALLSLSAGSTVPTFDEWNVLLDPQAIRCLLTSDLPIALYPCATGKDCYSKDHHNTFYSLSSLSWFREMDPGLKRYLAYAFEPSHRVDFLRALEEDPDESTLTRIGERSHSVWETAPWVNVAGRVIATLPDGTYRIIPKDSVDPSWEIIRNDLVPCQVEPREDGLFTWRMARPDESTRTTIFARDDPDVYEQALNNALPCLYQSFSTSGTAQRT